MDVFGASNRYAGEGDNPILDQDLDDPDGYEEPDPGLGICLETSLLVRLFS